MALTADQKTKMKSIHQRAACRFVSFPVFNIQSVISFGDGVYSFQDMVNIHPRHSWVDNSGTVVLDGNDSVQRGGAAATGHTWSLEAGSGSITDNLDGTCDYDAPASGTGTATIKLVTDGNAQENYAYVVYGDSSLNVGEILAFHADIGTGGWEMTIRGYGDCTGLERQKGVLLVVDDYWNGSEDTFGGYAWAHGVFYGYVDRKLRIHQDSELVYAEFKLVSPGNLLDFGEICDLYFVQLDTADDNIVIADFVVMDAIWYILTECYFNLRHNVDIFTDANSVANLKLARGPIFQVIMDIAKRTFCATYNSKLGDFYVIPSPDIRAAEWFDGLSEEFDVDEDLYGAIDIEYEILADPNDDPPSPPDPTVHQVILGAIESDLEDLSSSFPDAITATGGKKAEVSGLICETQATLDDWAKHYYYTVNREFTATATWFLMHHVDLYTKLGKQISLRAADLSNTDYNDPGGSLYVTGIDYTIDPGMGTWQGSTEIVAHAEPL